MRIFAVVRALPLVVLASLAACHRQAFVPSPTPQQLDAIHVQCQERIDKGAIALGRTKWVGFVDESATPDAPVVLYGASWCAACHIAADYMTRRGIPFVMKDVESDPAAKDAADAMLAKAGLTAGGLPIIHLRGTVMVGFTPCLVDLAWRQRTSPDPGAG
jgi:glutaredoxin